MPNPQIRKAGKWNAYIQQGSTFNRSFRIADLDLSTYSIRGAIVKTYGGAVLATYTCTVTGENTFDIELTPAQTAALPAGDLLHDFEMFSAEDAYVARIMEGKVKVSPEVTR